MRKKHKIFLLSISLITTILVIGLFFLFLRIIRNKNEHTAKVLTTLQNQIIEKDNANISDEEITNNEKTKEVVNSHFVDPQNISGFTDYLQSLGLAAGTQLSVNAITPSTTEKNTLLVKISIQGEFSKIMNVMDLLNNTPYQITIKEINLNKDPQSTEKTPIWQVDVSFTVLSS